MPEWELNAAGDPLQFQGLAEQGLGYVQAV